MFQLTKQETKVAHLVAKGLLEKEIADKLCISEHTVHAHTRNIRAKLGARNSVDITRIYILSLPNPRLVLTAIGFCIIQIGLLFSGSDFDARISRLAKVRGNRIVKVRKNEA